VTRRLRPPAPLEVQAGPDGRPLRLRRGWRAHTVTRVTATWIRPAAWWGDDADAVGGTGDPLAGERAYYRVVLDEVLVYELFRAAEGGWYLERIID